VELLPPSWVRAGELKPAARRRDTGELLPPLAPLQVLAVAACHAADRRRAPLNRVLGGRAVATGTRQRTRIR
jgi:hypothetical protein